MSGTGFNVTDSMTAVFDFKDIGACEFPQKEEWMEGNKFLLVGF